MSSSLPTSCVSTTLSPSKVEKTSQSLRSSVIRFSAMYPAPPQARRASTMVSLANAVTVALMPAAWVSISRRLTSSNASGLRSNSSSSAMIAFWAHA